MPSTVRTPTAPPNEPPRSLLYLALLAQRRTRARSRLARQLRWPLYLSVLALLFSVCSSGWLLIRERSQQTENVQLRVELTVLRQELLSLRQAHMTQVVQRDTENKALHGRIDRIPSVEAGVVKLEEVQKQQTEVKQQLADCQQKLTEAQKQLAEAKQQLAEAKQQLAEAKQQLEVVKQQLAEAKQQLAEAKPQVAEGKRLLAELKPFQEQLTDLSQRLFNLKLKLKLKFPELG